MHINPAQVSIGEMLSNRGTFEVPKYQRNYAWDESQIASFLKDLELCRGARLADSDKPRHHFFGGIVTASATATGSTRPNNELIDGQQRLATFMMLMVQVKQTMLRLAHDAQTGGDQELHDFLVAKAKLIADRYETFSDSINMRIVQVPRVQLSAPDQPFFDAMLRGATPPPQRRSHELLASGFAAIGQHLATIVGSLGDVAARTAALETIVQVVEMDWTVIHMAATQRKDAYMLFQVLNDRGRSLTEGELLRASTLEAIEPVAPAHVMEAVEQGWDAILSGRNHDVRMGLQWVHASQVGEWPGRSTLLADLTRNLFPPLASEEPLTRVQADEVAASVASVQRDFKILDEILAGEWPVTAHAAIRAWDRDRLRLLVVHLRQVDCLPLLIAASLLPPQHFSEIVQVLERFCFRYSIAVDGPPLEAIAIYDRHAVDIRRDPAAYRPGGLVQELRELIERLAPDEVFRPRLEALHYTRSESRKPLKYYLMTLEHFARWFDDGAQGRPTCRDNTRVLDFENSTIEHIYPENAAEPDPLLEPYLDTLGNLTILGPEDNDAAGHKSFADKRRYFEASQNTLNRQVAAEANWTADAVRQRQERLVQMGLSVFRL
ncbi:hypothetical protein BBF93_14495 [Hyphomonas sp. CACIAM 19H1]|uniref:DUF262 domain-containing protein n=1 Tax=Hyphomonas sp. CACIAM 19H1 TaxID=1873716 RepID=UPI000DEDC4C4|nr:DUF262 domain-containing HNH endonuclease family protein [Hyphomonas sp. CACIAM 19H1]AXE65289.1 hypothetical protein BBF93_14495 [Hyphomonas sp. CACIAM 19H1]